MGVIDLNVEAQHPEGKIQLLDGRVLDCYQSSEQNETVDNGLQLDTTGEYLSVGKNPQPAMTVKGNVEKMRMAERKLFTDNAFLFLDIRERILSDSRMFLCPVPVQSDIAYTGTRGFNRPTLGIYLEWWKYCAAASVLDDNDEEWLVYQIAGSPMSGGNRCSLVNPFGETKTEHVSSFINLWPRFIKINCRYDDAKERYAAYTLGQVLSILEKEGCMDGDKQAKHIPFLEQVNYGLRKRVDYLNTYVNKMRERMHQVLIMSKVNELGDFMSEYQKRENAKNGRLADIQAKRIELRKQLRKGIIDNLQYQREWMPLHKEKDNLIFEVNHFAIETLRTLYPNDSITLTEVREFLDKQKHDSDLQHSTDTIQ